MVFFFFLLSNRPRRTLTSRFLITLLCYGGVPEEYFLELLQSAIEGAENACYDYEDALRSKFKIRLLHSVQFTCCHKISILFMFFSHLFMFDLDYYSHVVLTVAFSYADMEDSMSARMILSGIPLEESYLQHRLDFMAQQERKGIKQGKIPIDECYYLMDTTDPTGTLRPNEVCVILLVTELPLLHLHILSAVFICISDPQFTIHQSPYSIGISTIQHGHHWNCFNVL